MPQHNSVPVSQSLLELFGTVRQQAEQYKAVYETLLRKAYELDQFRASAYHEFDQLKHSVRQLQHSLQSAVESELTQFRDHVQDVERIYGELAAIEKLRENLSKLEERFVKRTIELDAILLSIRQMVETATDERFGKLEDYIASKLRTIEGDVSTLDSHIYAMQEFFKKEIADLSEDLARYKKKIPETRYILDETSKYIVSMLDEAERRFNDKLNDYSAQVDERIGQALLRLFGNTDLASDLARANARAQEIVRRADALERRMSLSVWISLVLGGVALILALITILT
jgi:seryl-tRNA synthetase